jgi:hypothetical protein
MAVSLLSRIKTWSIIQTLSRGGFWTKTEIEGTIRKPRSLIGREILGNLENRIYNDL